MRKLSLRGHLSLIIIIIFLVLAALYLNLAYAHIYSKIQSAGLKNVKQSVVYNFNTTNNRIASSSPILKYVALGDSLTYGVGINNYWESYPYLVASNIADKNNEQTLTLYNYSWPGDKTSDLIAKFLDSGIKEKPGLVTILIGVNDIHNQISASDFKANYAKILSRLKSETTADVYVISIPYIGADTLIMPPYNYYFNYKTKQFNKIIKDLADEYKVDYVDLYTPTLSLFKKTGDHYSVDLFHPSASGYALWGKIIYDSINK